MRAIALPHGHTLQVPRQDFAYSSAVFYGLDAVLRGIEQRPVGRRWRPAAAGKWPHGSGMVRTPSIEQECRQACCVPKAESWRSFAVAPNSKAASYTCLNMLSCDPLKAT